MTPCPNFIAGERQTPAATQTLLVYDPSRGEVMAQASLCDAATVNDAVGAAAAAFPAWLDTPPTERAQVTDSRWFSYGEDSIWADRSQ